MVKVGRIEYYHDRFYNITRAMLVNPDEKLITEAKSKGRNLYNLLDQGSCLLWPDNLNKLDEETKAYSVSTAIQYIGKIVGDIGCKLTIDKLYDSKKINSEKTIIPQIDRLSDLVTKFSEYSRTLLEIGEGNKNRLSIKKIAKLHNDFIQMIEKVDPESEDAYQKELSFLEKNFTPESLSHDKYQKKAGELTLNNSEVFKCINQKIGQDCFITARQIEHDQDKMKLIKSFKRNYKTPYKLELEAVDNKNHLKPN